MNEQTAKIAAKLIEAIGDSEQRIRELESDSFTLVLQIDSDGSEVDISYLYFDEQEYLVSKLKKYHEIKIKEAKQELSRL